MTRQPIPTLVQYMDRMWRAKAHEYMITLAEARELWPTHAYSGEWWKHVVAEFDAGADFTPQATARLTATQLRDLHRSTRGLTTRLPDRYLRPVAERTGR